jgi:hypothetical protein
MASDDHTHSRAHWSTSLWEELRRLLRDQRSIAGSAPLKRGEAPELHHLREIALASRIVSSIQ